MFSKSKNPATKIILIFLSVLFIFPKNANSQDNNRYNKNRIQPWVKNPRYWQYKGKPVMLLGASDDDNIFQWTSDNLIQHLNLMKKNGANYVRNTMSDRKDLGFEIYPFKQLENGKYDLNQWNDEYWKRFSFFLRETSKRNIFVQIELWDRFDYSREHWEIHPYNPKNNINYDSKQAGLTYEYPDHPGLNKQPFFFTTPKQRDNQTLLPIQKKFVEKLMSYSLNYDHVLYCIDNETSGEAAWGLYWSEFITKKAADKNKEICVTEMWDSWNLQSSMHKNTFDHPEHFQFCDISQNTHQNGEKLWNNLNWVYNYLQKHPRPLNIVKTYGADGGRFGENKNGIERWWLHLLGGTASVRFHRPPAGLGLSELSISSVKAARKLEKEVKFWDLTVDNKTVGNNSENRAYAATNSKYCVAFLPEGGIIQLNIDSESPKVKIKYLNQSSGEWLKVEKQKNDLSGKIKIEAPDNNQWVILIEK